MIQEHPGVALVFGSDGRLTPVLCSKNDPEDRDDLGFMEFFDWLAKTKNEELVLLAKDLSEDDRHTVLGALEMGNREAAGQVIWRNM